MAPVVVAREFIMLRIPCDTFLRARYVRLSFRPRLENQVRNGVVLFSKFAHSPLPFSLYPPFTLADKPHRPVVSRQLAEQQTTRGIFERVLYTLPSIASHLHALRNRSVADGSRERERETIEERRREVSFSCNVNVTFVCMGSPGNARVKFISRERERIDEQFVLELPFNSREFARLCMYTS